MTDEEGNSGTEMYPSAQNIVRSVPLGIIQVPNVLKTPNFTATGDR